MYEPVNLFIFFFFYPLNSTFQLLTPIFFFLSQNVAEGLVRPMDVVNFLKYQRVISVEIQPQTAFMGSNFS